MKNAHQTLSRWPASVPSYAVDLLAAARLVSYPPVNATPEMLAEYQEHLNAAVIAFEAAMPIAADGEIVMDHINAGA